MNTASQNLLGHSRQTKRCTCSIRNGKGITQSAVGIIPPRTFHNIYYKYAKDGRAVETMQKVLNSGTADITYVYEKWTTKDGNINVYLKNAFTARDRDVVSLFSEIENELKSNIQKTVIFYARG